MPEAPYIRDSDGVVREGATPRPGELSALNIDGADLTFIRIDHQTRLQFGSTEIVIETPFNLRVDGTEHVLDPADRAGLGPLLAVYPATLESAVVLADLTISLSFTNGAELSVRQHERYESWHVMGPGSRWIVCPPPGNGTLSVWR